MNWWNKLNTKWTEEELRSFNSISKTIYILFPIVIYYLANDVTEVLLWFVLNSVAGRVSENMLEILAKYGSTIRSMIYGAGLLVGILILKKCAIAEVDIDSNKKMATRDILAVIVIALVSSLGMNYLFNLIGFTSSSQVYDNVYNSQFSVAFISGLFLYGIISPVAEEIIFRGIVYNRMKRIFPQILSMLVSALLFGVFHGNIVQGVYGTIMGIIIVFLYEKYNNFLAPVLVHVVANIGVYVLTYSIWK